MVNVLDPSLLMRAKGTPTGNSDGSLPNFNAQKTEKMRDFTALNNYYEGYKINDIVFTCASIRTDAIKKAPIVLCDANKPDEIIPFDPKIPLYNLLYSPNEYYGGKNMLSMLEGYIILGGNAYLKCGRENGVITKLFAYHSSVIQPKVTDSNWIDHYEFDNGSQKIPIDISDIIHFRWPSVDLVRPYLALGPLVPSAKEIDIENVRAQLEINILNQGVAPSYVITMPDGTVMNPTQANAIGEMIQTRFGGKNQSRAAVVPFGTGIQELSNNVGEWSTIAFVKIPETRICGSLDIPIQITPFLSSSDVKTYANYAEANKHFYKKMQNTWENYGETLTNFFAKEKFPGDKRQYIIKFDTRNIPELNAKAELAQSQYEGDIITVNECRQQLGYDPMEGPTGEMLFSQVAAKIATAPPAPAAQV